MDHQGPALEGNQEEPKMEKEELEPLPLGRGVSSSCCWHPLGCTRGIRLIHACGAQVRRVSEALHRTALAGNVTEKEKKNRNFKLTILSR